MPRRADIQFRELEPDPVYSSKLVNQVINKVMLRGKKSTAEQIVYSALEKIGERTGRPPADVLEQAVKTVTPVLEVRSRRVGGANYQVPREVRPERRAALSMKWIVEAARAKKGKPMAEKLADEILAASKNEGEAIKKRENMHKMAEANKAFAHFAW